MTMIAIHSQFDKVVEDLSERFLDATTDRVGPKRIRRNNSKGTPLYKSQVEFAYMVNEITSGPTYIAPKIIDNASRFIDSINKQRQEAPAA